MASMMALEQGSFHAGWSMAWEERRTSAIFADSKTPAIFTFAGWTSAHQRPTNVTSTPGSREASAMAANPFRGLSDHDTAARRSTPPLHAPSGAG